MNQLNKNTLNTDYNNVPRVKKRETQKLIKLYTYTHIHTQIILITVKVCISRFRFFLF